MSAPPLPAGSPRARDAIFTVAPYVGGESKVAGANRVIKLSSNEGAFGPPPGAINAMAALATQLHRYPDGGSAALRTAIGAHFDLDPARIVCGNGSDELISLLIQSYGGPGTELIMSAHGFLMYEISGKLAGMTVRKTPERDLNADIDAMLAAVRSATRLVFLANPNNPTGSLVPQAEVERLRAGLPSDVLLVLDAAYAEYVDDARYDPGIGLVDAGSNTVMTRTFSKIFGLGGARLGWAYAPAPIIDVLNRARGPFNVNATAAAAIAALAEPGWVAYNRTHNQQARAALTQRLRNAGLKIYPSHGNFILTDFGSAARASAADAHLRARGILVRAMASYDLAQCLRVTIGTDEECGLAAAAIEDFLGHG